MMGPRGRLPAVWQTARESPWLPLRDRQTLLSRDFAQSRGVKETGVDISRLESGIGVQNGFPGGAVGEHRQHHRRRDAAASDHGLAAHFPGLGNNTREKIGRVHILNIAS